MKHTRFLFLIVITLFSSFTLLAKESQDKTTKILIVSGWHSAHAKTRLFNQLGREKGLHFEHKSTRSLGENKQNLFNQYALVIFNSEGAEDAKKSFSSFSADIKQS